MNEPTTSSTDPVQVVKPGHTFTQDGVTYSVVPRTGRRPKGEPPPAGPTSTELGNRISATHRRAPRVKIFLACGVLLGMIAAAIATAIGTIDPLLGPVRTFGWFSLVTVPIGLVLALAAIYYFDWRSRQATTDDTTTE